MKKCSIAVAYPEALATAPFLYRGDWKEIIEQAHGSGYDAVELHIRRPDRVKAEELRRFAEGLGMEFSGVATGMSYTMDGLSLTDECEEGREAAQYRLFQYVDLAAGLGCCVILGSIRGNLTADSDKSLEQFEESLAKVLDYAAEQDVTVCIEAINRYENNFLNTVSEVENLIRRMGRDNLKIHADVFHMNIEETSFEQAVQDGKGDIGYVHLADNNRKYLGAGMVDFERIVGCLKAAGYDGYLSLECLPLPDARTAADLSIRVMRKLCG